MSSFNSASSSGFSLVLVAGNVGTAHQRTGQAQCIPLLKPWGLALSLLPLPSGQQVSSGAQKKPSSAFQWWRSWQFFSIALTLRPIPGMLKPLGPSPALFQGLPDPWSHVAPGWEEPWQYQALGTLSPPLSSCPGVGSKRKLDLPCILPDGCGEQRRLRFQGLTSPAFLLRNPLSALPQFRDKCPPVVGWVFRVGRCKLLNLDWIIYEVLP